MIVTSKYILFFGDVFSNFYPCKITITSEIDGELEFLTFSSSEQYFMWKKAITFNDHETAGKILETNEPYKAKKLGRLVKNYDDNVWSEIRFDVMVEALRHKFNSSNILRNCLQLTLGRTIVEGSPYDKIWGVGLWYNDPKILNEYNWDGQNLLGKALMQVRDEMFVWGENSPDWSEWIK